MSEVLVASVSAGTVTAFGETVRAAFGKGGAIAAADKREGDGASPLGVWPIRAALLRPDRMAAPVTRLELAMAPLTRLELATAPLTRLPWRWLRSDDGWSDGVNDPAYNRLVRHPHAFSAERLWREDGVYDIILILAHNDAPPVTPLGSAIFFHCIRPDAAPTEGCVAVARDVLARWLGRLAPGDAIRIDP